MKKRIIMIFIALGIFSVSSCTLDLLENPNAVTQDSADPNFLLNRVQIDFANFFNGTSNVGMRLTRMLNQGANTYETAYLPQNFDGIWSNAYSNLLNDIQTVKTIAEARNLNRHMGIAKTLEAYTLMTLVDCFGDVPYSEAFNPSEFNPGKDNASAVYAKALALLSEAEASFNATNVGTPVDFYYNNNKDRWLRLINTLRLKYHLSTRLVNASASTTAINALIAQNNFLKDGDSFWFRYSRNIANPDSRHPRFVGTYLTGGGDYQSNFYMWHMTEAKGFDDPRARYYFYRQVGSNPTDVNELRCINEFAPIHYQGFQFCLPGTRGYWGRDHLDNQGIPPDGLRRTVWGVYPAGGRFDNNSFTAVNNQNLGNQGAGIQPIMNASFVDFMLAEASLFLGTSGNAKSYLQSAIQKSMDEVRGFALTSLEAGTITAYTSNANFNTSVANYLTFIGNEYDAATSNTARMRVVGREFWLALFGNGVESYNLYRRTGQPSPMQPGLFPAFGDFPRSLLYPANFVNRNNKADQKAGLKVRVFWDNNPENGWVN
jgi:hypothetical protein